MLQALLTFRLLRLSSTPTFRLTLTRLAAGSMLQPRESGHKFESLVWAQHCHPVHNQVRKLTMSYPTMLSQDKVGWLIQDPS